MKAGWGGEQNRVSSPSLSFDECWENLDAALSGGMVMCLELNLISPGAIFLNHIILSSNMSNAPIYMK